MTRFAPSPVLCAATLCGAEAGRGAAGRGFGACHPEDASPHDAVILACHPEPAKVAQRRHPVAKDLRRRQAPYPIHALCPMPTSALDGGLGPRWPWLQVPHGLNSCAIIAVSACADTHIQPDPLSYRPRPQVARIGKHQRPGQLRAAHPDGELRRHILGQRRQRRLGLLLLGVEGLDLGVARRRRSAARSPSTRDWAGGRFASPRSCRRPHHRG